MRKPLVAINVFVWVVAIASFPRHGVMCCALQHHRICDLRHMILVCLTAGYMVHDGLGWWFSEGLELYFTVATLHQHLDWPRVTIVRPTYLMDRIFRVGQPVWNSAVEWLSITFTPSLLVLLSHLRPLRLRGSFPHFALCMDSVRLSDASFEENLARRSKRKRLADAHGAFERAILYDQTLG